MKIVEAMTIYLAAGAPFGVSRYLARETVAPRTRSLLAGAWAVLLWPMAAARFLFERARRKTGAASRQDSSGEPAPDDAEKVERARRQLLATLQRVQELARMLSEKEGRRTERVACVVRESVEKYVGLTLGGAHELSSDSTPTEREMELCRVAGRTGDDLLLAGRCIHRRNLARLVAHRAQARTNLLHSLAEVRESSDDGSAATARTRVSAARHASVAVLRLYGQAINLLSLLEDEEAAMKVARLLDVECARLHRLEAALEASVADRSPAEQHPAGEEPCKPHTPPLAFIGPSPTSPLTRA